MSSPFPHKLAHFLAILLFKQSVFNHSFLNYIVFTVHALEVLRGHLSLQSFITSIHFIIHLMKRLILTLIEISKNSTIVVLILYTKYLPLLSIKVHKHKVSCISKST